MTQPKTFHSISETSDILNVPQHVLRFWETKFKQIKPIKRAGRRRYYRDEDIQLLQGIQHLLYQDGYTIKGVQRLLREEGVGFVMDYPASLDPENIRKREQDAFDAAQIDLIDDTLSELSKREANLGQNSAQTDLFVPERVEAPQKPKSIQQKLKNSPQQAEMPPAEKAVDANPHLQKQREDQSQHIDAARIARHTRRSELIAARQKLQQTRARLITLKDEATKLDGPSSQGNSF